MHMDLTVTSALPHTLSWVATGRSCAARLTDPPNASLKALFISDPAQVVGESLDPQIDNQKLLPGLSHGC